jgi:hypothetical protein
LMYKLQRKNAVQSNEDSTSSEEEAICIQLFVVWKVHRFGAFFVYLFLIGHDGDRIWDKNKLLKLAKCYKLVNIQHSPIEETWLMHDSTVIMTRMNLTRKEDCYKLEMTISKTDIKDDTRRLQYIGMNR